MKSSRWARFLGLPTEAPVIDFNSIRKVSSSPEVFVSGDLPPVHFPDSSSSSSSFPSPPSLTASAQRITERQIDRRGAIIQGANVSAQDWQTEAWALLDQVGEQRFIVNMLAGQLSQASLYVGQTSSDDSPGTRPEKVEDARLQDALHVLGSGPAGQSQMLFRMSVNLSVVGEFWVIGIPPRYVPGTDAYARYNDEEVDNIALSVSRGVSLSPRGSDRDDDADEDDDLMDLEDASDVDDVLSLVWRIFSVSEISFPAGDDADILMDDGSTISVPVSDLWLIRVWRPHPRKSWEADSPTRASLPVLRELVGLTMHVSAQLDSRLAGAGLLLFSSEASADLKRQRGIIENSSSDPLMEALTQAMMTPISDRASASAVVPLVATVPNPESAAKYISFSTPLDKESPKLREEAIRRLALGQDAPPEVLLGVGGMNHWGAWAVQEDTIKTHIEPPLALICDALTTDYLRPLAEAMGYSEEQASHLVIWYDVDSLISRPNRAADAKDLFAAGAISIDAFREALGFEDADAPEEDTRDLYSRAVDLALSAVSRAPSLISDPGLPMLVAQIFAALSGESIPASPTSVANSLVAPTSSPQSGASRQGPPQTQNNPAPE